MSWSLGGITFDMETTHLKERWEEAGGATGRVIELSGLMREDDHGSGSLEEQLDAILGAAPEDAYTAILSLREGRRLRVRREGFTWEYAPERSAVAYKLTLRAVPGWEEAEEEAHAVWCVTTHEGESSLDVDGNTWTAPVVMITASGTLRGLSLSDGTRAIAYGGMLAAGETLIWDGPAGTVMVEERDVSAQTRGLFPRCKPGGSMLTHRHEEAPEGTLVFVTASWRARWL